MGGYSEVLFKCINLSSIKLPNIIEDNFLNLSKD